MANSPAPLTSRSISRQSQIAVVPIDLVFGAAIWFGLTAIITWATFPPDHGSWASTFKAIGLSMGVATGVFAPISAIFMAKYQSQLTGNLEELKADYTVQVEELKSSLSAGLEVKKALIAARIRAFDSMLNSAHFFYYVLRRLAFSEVEPGEEVLVEAESRAAEASSVVWHLDQEDRQKWFDVYQRSIHLVSLLKKEPKEGRVALFNSNAVELGRAIEALEEAGLAVFAEADRYNLQVSQDEFRISGARFIR